MEIYNYQRLFLRNLANKFWRNSFWHQNSNVCKLTLTTGSFYLSDTTRSISFHSKYQRKSISSFLFSTSFLARGLLFAQTSRSKLYLCSQAFVHATSSFIVLLGIAIWIFPIDIWAFWVWSYFGSLFKDRILPIFFAVIILVIIIPDRNIMLSWWK